MLLTFVPHVRREKSGLGHRQLWCKYNLIHILRPPVTFCFEVFEGVKAIFWVGQPTPLDPIILTLGEQHTHNVRFI